MERAPTLERQGVDAPAGGKAYLLIGGPEHGKLLAVPSPTPSIEFAELTEDVTGRIDGPPTPAQPLSWRNRNYVTRDLGALERDGVGWQLAVGVWDTLARLSDTEIFPYAMAAMVRYVPTVRKHEPERLRFREVVLLDKNDEPTELVTVAPSADGYLMLLPPVSGHTPRGKIIDTSPDAPTPRTPLWVIIDEDGRVRPRHVGPRDALWTPGP